MRYGILNWTSAFALVFFLAGNVFTLEAGAAPSPHSQRVREMRRAENSAHAHKNTLVDYIERGKVGISSQRAVNMMVRKAYKVLIKNGHKEYAETVKAQWLANFETKLLAIDIYADVNALDLGDFEVMWQWLDDFYNTLESKLGEKVMKMSNLTDIRDFNHAVKVVFTPRDIRWDAAEYKLHFKPFLGIIGYWGSLASCIGLTFGATGGIFCTPISIAVRGGMNVIGGALSNMVYNLATKNKSPQMTAGI